MTEHLHLLTDAARSTSTSKVQVGVVMHPRNAYASPPDFLGLARSYPPLRPQYVLAFETKDNPTTMTGACS